MRPAGTGETVVVVGAGQAGAQTVASLRQEGFDGQITLVGDEPVLPYQRPPLSKAYLAGTVPLGRLLVRPATFYYQARVEVLLGTSVAELDTGRRRVRLSGGRGVAFDHLVLATGGRPRRLQCPGSEDPRIHYLRTVADVDRIRTQLRPGARLVLVGGGYIGLEIAAVAATLGLSVTVVEAAATVLARVTCPAVARFFEGIHRRAGVTIRCATTVDRIDATPFGVRVVLDDGQGVDADLVVVGIGLVPNIALASSAGLDCDNGIVVDEHCRTSVPGIYAAGDCTQYPSPIYGRPVHLESVHNAIEQAKSTAAAICGRPRPVDQVPWFWSDQYDIKLQTAGVLHGYDEVAVRGDPGTGSFAAFYLRAGRLLAIDAINRPREFMAAKPLIAERTVIDPDRLVDDELPVKALVAG
ncbi:MAG: FAD-dependent oxidoreductase [Actinomycetota bacterium]|nr:FAD-dependent oxidoreductase [Actinomycetota bacterium]